MEAEKPPPCQLDNILIWSAVEKCDSKFDHLKTLGVIKYKVPLCKRRKTHFRFEDPLFKLITIDKAPILKLTGDYYMADGDIASYELSIKKMDVAPVRMYLKDGTTWLKVKQIVYMQLEDAFKNVSYPHDLETILPRMNKNASCGFPLSLFFKSKEKALSDAWARDYIFDVGISDYEPVWRAIAKREWYSLEDILSGKVRTFIIPPLKLLILQLSFYTGQNNALKELWWSSYGFNPYFGGVNRLAHRLLLRRYKIYYDVKGWDRKYPHMKDVYDLRNHFFSPEYKEIVKWIALHTEKSVLLLADGVLVYKEISNNSGSGCTTPDNIIGHMLTLTYVLLQLYDGCVEKVLQVIANLFGDDNMMSLDSPKNPAEIERIFRSGYLDFGWELDPFVITEELEGCEFLGFQFHEITPGLWVPRFNLARIATAFCYEFDKTDLSQQLSKSYSLLLMSWPHGEEVFNLFSDVYLSILRLDIVREQYNKNPIITAYLDLGVPTEDELESFYIGYETCLLRPLFRMEVAQKIGLRDYEQSYAWREAYGEAGGKRKFDPCWERLVNCCIRSDARHPAQGASGVAGSM